MAQRADPATPFVARPGEGRWITDGGGTAPGLPSGQPEAGAAADEVDGLEAPGPKPKTTRPSAQHRISLTAARSCDRRNQVWAADIT
jgi:hypothetical protein